MKIIILLISGVILPGFTLAASCDDYPYTDNVNAEDVAGGTKIISTATASVAVDDIDSVMDAKDEATLLAKAAISKFLSETISSDETVNKVVNETKSMSGADKVALRKEVVERLKTLRNSSKALLRGVVPLGECYTKGQMVRVSVGIKPETINSAGNLAGGISNSLQNSSTPTKQSNITAPLGSAGSSNSAQVPTQGVDSYSNTSRLKNF